MTMTSTGTPVCANAERIARPTQRATLKLGMITETSSGDLAALPPPAVTVEPSTRAGGGTVR